MTIKPVTILPHVWLYNSLPPSAWNSLSNFFLLPVNGTTMMKNTYQKIGFALKTDAATQQPKDGVCCLVNDVCNLTCLVLPVGDLSLQHCPNTK